jgi:5-methyltetrahydropteroyltriglutamate--homocysteine methyltransferase
VFTATKDVMLPTTVVGSWPRPVWYTHNMEARPFSTAMNDLTFREQYMDAVATVVSDQEYAGLDILTNGDYHLDADFAGRSWHNYSLQRMSGMSEYELDATDPRWGKPNGTWGNEIMAGWRFPSVVGKIGPKIPFEYGKIWRTAQARATKPVKMGANTADVLGAVVNVHTDLYDDDRRQLMWDFATVINQELRELVAAGCRVVQVEDPQLHYATTFNQDDSVVDFLVDLFNYEVQGLEEAEIWIHTCWGNAGSQGAPGDRRKYDSSIDHYLNRLNADVLQIESKDSGHEPRALFAKYKGQRLPMKLCVGALSHRTLQVESVDEVAGDIRSWLEYVEADQLCLGSDCGFGRQGVPRPIALYKAAALAQGANVVRRELGVEEHFVPAADRLRQVDPSPVEVGFFG